MKKFILCCFMLMVSTSALWADAVTFQATVDSSQVSLDDVLQLTLTITGVNDNNMTPVSLPVMDGFTAKYLGPSTSVTIVNGDYHSSRSFVYNLFPNKTGKFQIPAISTTISGQNYATQPIDIEVTQGQDQSQSSAGGAAQNSPQGQESIKDKLKVKVEIEKTDVYLNERVPVTIKFLVSDVPIRDIQYPTFDKSGLYVDDFDKPLQATEVINGVSYNEAQFKTYIYPDHLGDLTFGPVQMQCNVLYKTGQSNPFGENNPFGADVFNNFFESYATRPETVTSQPIVLHVSTLPEADRPNDFSGAIGQFDFQASVSPLKVKAGDPLTLKMDVQGNGNFKSMKMPDFQAAGFKSYAPQIKGTGDDKTLEQVIIPRSTGIKEVPALHFSYFDTVLKDYKTITQGPFAIEVTAPSPDQEFKAIGFTDVSKEPLMPASSPFSFVKIFQKIRHVSGVLLRSIWFWIVLGILIAASIGYFLWRRFQDKLQNNPAFARRLKAIREARQALVPAEGLISNGKTKDFYALISKVLCDYLANKWHQSSAALSVQEIVTHLKSVQLDENHIGQIKTLLEQSDLVCFAGATFDATQMRQDLTQAQELIAYLEKSLK